MTTSHQGSASRRSTSPARDSAPERAVENYRRREYPIVVAALSRFIAGIPAQHPYVSSVVLFGSVARLTPYETSDTDLLVLFDLCGDAGPTSLENRLADAVLATVMQTFYADGLQWPQWGISMLTADAQAPGLDSDLLRVIGREGVLLYHMEDSPLPDPLAHLMPLPVWLRRIEGQLGPLLLG